MFTNLDQIKPQYYCIDREEEDAILNKVLQEQQESAISSAIDSRISDPYDRMVIKLIALDGWYPELVAEHAGVPERDILQKLRRLAPQILDAMLQVKTSPLFA